MHRISRFALVPVVLAAVFAAFGPAHGVATFSAPVIDYPPTPQATVAGGTVHFTVIAHGTPPLTYQWRKDGTNLDGGGTVSGATADTLTLAGVTGADAAGYSVVVSNASGSATSADAALSVTSPQAGDVDLSFGAGLSRAEGWAVALQPDGKILVGGKFALLNGTPRNNIARLNADGSLDHTFANALAGPNGRVFCLAVQPDGRVLIGGQFTTVNGVSRGHIARLNADGSLDTTFLNGLTGVGDDIYEPYVRTLALQTDGRVLIGGIFVTINGVSRQNIARLNADGSLDTTFQHLSFAGASSSNGPSVQSIALQSDGRVLIGGEFFLLNDLYSNGIARLNFDGSRDTTFFTQLTGYFGISPAVDAIVLQPDGRVLIGGFFTEVDGVSRGDLARLNPDGSLDTSFLEGLDGVYGGSVQSIALQPDGRVLIGGTIYSVNGVFQYAIARLNVDGSLDTTFQSALDVPDTDIYSLALQPNGRVVIGGPFTRVGGVNCNGIARLNADASRDDTFANQSPNERKAPDDLLTALALQPDGRVLIGGYFFTVDGADRSGIARLNADGSLDTSFLNGLTGVEGGYLGSLALQPDGRVLLAGNFSGINGFTSHNLARLNADGSRDTTFSNGINSSGGTGSAYCVAVQPDGRILVGGDFQTTFGQIRKYIARLNANGSIDTTFLTSIAGADRFVDAVAVQPDGRLLIGGYFATVNGVSRNGLARVNSDGSLDTTFLPGLTLDGYSPYVYAIALQPDGRVLVGGSFTAVNGVSRNGLARLNADGSLDTSFVAAIDPVEGWYISVYSLGLQPDGRVLIGGDFTGVSGVSRYHFARLNADGSLDTTFDTRLAGGSDSDYVDYPSVFGFAVQPDERVLIGGNFMTVNGELRSFVARLYGAAPMPPAITSDPSTQASYDGCCATFHITATGSFLTYRWRKNGVDLEDGPHVSGAHTATLVLTGVTSADEGDYSVVVSNVMGIETSHDAALTVAAVPECKVATCDAVLGCVLIDAADGTACNDESACTTGDTCAGGSCVGGAPPACDDGDACTGVETCDPAGGCVAGVPVVCTASDQCHLAGTCDPGTGACSNSTVPDGTACDDGNSNTDGDVCTAGVCAGTVNCAVQPKPKSSGYYKSLCKDGHSHPSTHEDLLTDADAACVGSLTDTFAGISAIEDLCAVLEAGGGSGDGYDSKECVNGEQELMASALNVCRQRICLAQEVDSHCGTDPHQSMLTSVQASLDAADDILSDPGRDKDVCKDAKCLVKEINNGHGIHHTSLLLTKESGGKARLTWSSPVMEDGTGEATGYTVWRRELRSPLPFTRIGTTNANTTTFVDQTQGVFEYEVTFTIAP